ncbi:tetratricopeptide repeat protein [Algisphaera agarilytica]|uniref:Tetratricopeptide (TPR) repeat protein n=1 Tax=Algisphaera agarilytica TaxID=1385975 RepID=A0A7X0H6G0_9BACT|nr:tetratricopeptide repeat protein [Algisphaera agarilytica]MBB6428649.1 tetratricopeptide (TPR) repeat protein [Algisphaera agarilytica]
MFYRSCCIAVLLSGALLLASCASDPSRDPGSASGDASLSSEPIRLTDVPPPPGVPAATLTPFNDTQMGLAQLSRAEVLDSLATPAYLENLGQTPEERNIEPPLAAQKFYAAGRQALLENDNFRAVQQLEKALRLSPGEPKILKSLAEAWTRSGNRVSASNFYRQAVAADPTDLNSLFMLGRFALDERRWDQAVINLDAALQLAEPDYENADAKADPEAAHLIRYYLANALNQAGHSRAAAEMFDAYLTDRPRLSALTPYTREIAVLGNQRGETLMLVGDLYHRLNEPRTAWQAYSAAAEVGVLNPDTLLRRLLYTRLRLGQTRAAQELVTQAVADSQGNAKSLALIPYAVQQGVSAEALSAQLTALYEDRGRPASLALAMADVLPPDVAAPLLQQHLAEHPDDDMVFGRLLALLLGDAPSDENRQQAVAATINAMSASPDLAEAYADQLLANTDQPAALSAFLPEPPTSASLTLRGKLFLADAQTDEAFASFSQALELDPEADLARFELAALQLQRGQIEEAEALLEPLADSNHPRVTMLRVQALTQTGKTEEALTLINEVLRRTPPGSPLMLDKADLQLRLGRVQEAERTLLDALNARPTDEAIYEALLDIYSQNGNMIRNYQRLVRRMVDTIPNARITRLIQLETLIANRQYPQALALMDTLEPTGKDRLLLQRLRLEALIGTNQGDAVSSLIDQHLAEASAAQVAPSEEMLTLAVRYFTRRGEQDKALQLELTRWENAPPSTQRSGTLASIYFLQERYADAVKVTQEAFDQGLADNDPLQMMVLLVNSLFELERFEDAEQHVKDITKKFPDLGGEPAMFLAVIYEQRGDTEASRRVMEEALEDFPDHAGLNNSLGYGLANEGIRLDDAERMVARAVAAEPDVSAYLDSMGWVFYKKAEFERALEWLERSLKADSGNHPVIIDHLGDTYYRLDRPAEAVRMWNRAQQVMMADGYESMDPEEADLPERLNNKINAVAQDQPAPVADLGEGVEIPVQPELPDTPEALPTTPENPAAEPVLPAVDLPSEEAAPTAP